MSVRCNVTDETDVEAMAEAVVSTYGRLDAAYNNAGFNSPVADTAEASGEEFDNGIATKNIMFGYMIDTSLQSRSSPLTKSAALEYGAKIELGHREINPNRID